GISGRRADDPLGPVLHRLRNRDRHPAVLEAAGRIPPLELEAQLDAEVLADFARADERGAALAERERRRVGADRQAVAEALDHAHPSSATPRSETTRQRSGRPRASPRAATAES